MVVRYKKGITGYWFYYSIGSLNYAVVYPNKAEFLKANRYKNSEVKFEQIKD